MNMWEWMTQYGFWGWLAVTVWVSMLSGGIGDIGTRIVKVITNDKEKRSK